MIDIFGSENKSPELEIFLRIKNPSETAEAIDLFYAARQEGVCEKAAIEEALEEVVPTSWFGTLEGQSPEQPSS